MKRRYNIILPLCHGNGGWYGSKIIKTFDLESPPLGYRPDFDIEYDPYSYGRILNSPRMCLSDNINEPIMIWNEFDVKWEEIK